MLNGSYAAVRMTSAMKTAKITVLMVSQSELFIWNGHNEQLGQYTVCADLARADKAIRDPRCQSTLSVY